MTPRLAILFYYETGLAQVGLQQMVLLLGWPAWATIPVPHDYI